MKRRAELFEEAKRILRTLAPETRMASETEKSTAELFEAAPLSCPYCASNNTSTCDFGGPFCLDCGATFDGAGFVNGEWTGRQ